MADLLFREGIGVYLLVKTQGFKIAAVHRAGTLELEQTAFAFVGAKTIEGGAEGAAGIFELEAVSLLGDVEVHLFDKGTVSCLFND